MIKKIIGTIDSKDKEDIRITETVIKAGRYYDIRLFWNGYPTKRGITLTQKQVLKLVSLLGCVSFETSKNQ